MTAEEHNHVQQLEATVKRNRRRIVALKADRVVARQAIDQLLRACEALMPGLRHSAVQDYALLNDAPRAGRAALARLAEGDDEPCARRPRG